jgi:putative ABC transport system permease protein
MGALVLDVGYALRMLRKSPSFTLVAVASLALGIGANTALFSLVDTLLLKKLPVRDPDGLYQLTVTHRTGTGNDFSYPDFEKLRSSFDLFSGVCAWTMGSASADPGDGPRQVRTALVTGEYYQTLGVSPEIGRLIAPEDDKAGGSGAAVISDAFWRRRFAGSQDVLGKTIRVDKVPLTIVGVTPPDFFGAEVGQYSDITFPVHTYERMNPGRDLLRQASSYWLRVMARLKPGVSPAQARSVLLSVWPRLLEADGPAPVDGWTQKLHIEPGNTGYSAVRLEFSYALLLLMGLMALVLLIACANIANLLLVRATARRQEISVRLALGASRGRLLRQWLTESILLAGLGGALGLLVARWVTALLLLFLPQGGNSFLSFHLNPRVLAFTALLAFLTAILFGLLPALRATRTAPGFILKETGRGLGGGRRGWLTRFVVIAQIAVSLVLVIGAGLFARSLRNLTTMDAGFRRERLLLVDTNPAGAGYKGPRAGAFYRQLLERLASVRGVQSASMSSLTPISGGAWWDPAEVPGYVPAPNETTTVYLNAVSPGYFQTLGTALMAGRDFGARDTAGSPRVAIVNESFARRFFPSADPIGKTFSVARNIDMRNLEIVGVVKDSRYSSLREKPRELVYLALYQFGDGVGGTIAIRLAPEASAAAASSEIRRAVASLGADIPVEIRRFDEQIGRSLQQDRMVAMLSGFFGLLGLFLAAIGLYGVMAYTVSCRTGEIGVRMALGAGRPAVLWLVLRETLLLAGAGALIGAPAALAASRLVATQLFGLSAADPLTISVSTLTILSVAILAGYIPARRASGVDPTVALRYE